MRPNRWLGSGAGAGEITIRYVDLIWCYLLILSGARGGDKTERRVEYEIEASDSGASAGEISRLCDKIRR